MDERTLVAKVKNADKECFLFITLNADCSAITRMSYPALTEDDLWGALHKMGKPHDEIKALIETARDHPV
jgi:hypothetical protein